MLQHMHALRTFESLHLMYGTIPLTKLPLKQNVIKGIVKQMLYGFLHL